MGAFSPDANCTIPNNLVAYWKLDETSGSRSDSFGSNTLTDNNTVGSTAGKVGNAAQFIQANTEYLSAADNAALSVADIDFTFAFWVYLDSKTTGTSGNAALIVKESPAASEYEIIYAGDTTDRFIFTIFNSPGNTTSASVLANNFGSPSTGT